jgi:hypothetical protein
LIPIKFFSLPGGYQLNRESAMSKLFFKVIACEIAFREISFAASRSPQLIDLEFITQGLHDVPGTGRAVLQERIDAVPPGKYDAILLGYGLCGRIIADLQTPHTPLIVPRAHDCITFFLGSRKRYEEVSSARPGAYFYNSGWLECLQRRGENAPPGLNYLPSRAGASSQKNTIFEGWVKKYGEERARHLVEVMDRWTENYTHGVLIDFDFTARLKLREEVQGICSNRGWEFEELKGDLDLLQRWLDGEWDPKDFLTVQPREKIVPSYDDQVIGVEPIALETPQTQPRLKDHAH